MIQNRITICGSVQPNCSKWWWIGAIRKMRLPVSLNDTTCTITDTASSTNSPPITASTISCRAGRDRRTVRAGSGVGDRAGGVVQAHRQAHLPDGADPPPFRAIRLDRAADRDPVLDHLGGAGAGRPPHA